MKKILIITNELKDEKFLVTKRLEEVLKAAGMESIRYTGRQVGRDIDCAIVIGGDGTLLIAARLLVDLDIPILGINLGTLGFLVEVPTSEIEQAVQRLKDGDYYLEERMLIRGELIKPGVPDRTTFALNDIVLSKDSALSIIRYNLFVNERSLYTYNADGIIVSTPTGSTGYSLSAGGPIVEPTAELILVTPICAHSLGARSIILAPEDKLEIEILEVRKNVRSHGAVVSDGITIGELYCGDRLIITRSPKKTKLIKLDRISFLETMSARMNI